MKKKLAVVGYGGQGAWHGRKIQGSDVVALTGSYDTAPERQAFAKELGIHTYESFEEILADDTVEAVVVATPNDSHKELVIRSLDAGKHVICEKPVEMSVAAFDEMVEAANRNGKIFTVHQNRRWDAEYLAMKELVESGELGEAICIENRVHGSRGIPGDWRGTKAQGGGMVLDWGVHLIDQVLQIFKAPIIRINCVCTHITNDEVDDGFKLSLYFEDGKSALIEVGTHNFLALSRFYLQCQDGSAKIDTWGADVQLARVTCWKEENVVPIQTSAGITKTMAPRNSVSLDEYTRKLPDRDAHDFYRNFCKAVDGIEEPVIRNSEVRRVLQVMEAAFESDRKQQTLQVHI